MHNGSQGMQLLHDHVERFNAGVASGDFGPMLAAFTDDAEMVFEGIPVGPFHGKQAIAAAYREQPPDAQIQVLDATERDDGVLVARYAWVGQPGEPGGELRLTPQDGRITKLVVTFDQPS